MTRSGSFDSASTGLSSAKGKGMDAQLKLPTTATTTNSSAAKYKNRVYQMSSRDLMILDFSQKKKINLRSTFLQFG